ncbi:MAG: hypothetical protein LBC53_10725 [Spirochaetaceae bacterium]|nr:hypothetical protein [Spirochaetaceae bacterium]
MFPTFIKSFLWKTAPKKPLLKLRGALRFCASVYLANRYPPPPPATGSI